MFFDARIPLGKSQALSQGEESWSPKGVDCDRLQGFWLVVGFLVSHQPLEPSLKSPMSFSLSLFSPSGVYKIWEVLHV